MLKRGSAPRHRDGRGTEHQDRQLAPQGALHPTLEAAGLLRYRQSLLDAGAGPESPLWPGVEADSEGRRAGPWSKWFNRYLRNQAGVEDPAKVFHFFRHTFKRMARDANLQEEMHDFMTGHAGGGGVGRGYGRGFGLKAMAVEMAKIEAPEAVRGLRWSEEGAKGAKGANSKNR